MKTPEGDFTGINREAGKPAWLGLSCLHKIVELANQTSLGRRV